MYDTKTFLGVVKHLLSNKVVFNEKITLVEDDNITENDKNTASIWNEFFSNIITNLGIPKYTEREQGSHIIGDPVMKAVMKYRFHPSIVAIKENCDSGFSFAFSHVDIMKSLKKLITIKQIRPHKANAYPQNLLRKILIFLEILFLEIIIIAFPNLFFLTP